MGTALLLQDTMLRLVSAMLCGALLGWERETHHKPAGFRTNMLISLGAATFTLMSIHLAQQPGFAPDSRLDPLRAIQGIIGGIGFLGAGAIIRSGGSVHGMTTAATIWVVGAAGVACGMGAFEIALCSVTLCFLVLTGLSVLEKRMFRKHNGASDINEAG